MFRVNAVGFCLLASSLLSASAALAATSDRFEKEFAALHAKWDRNEKKGLIEKWNTFIERHSKDPRVIEAQFYVASLHRSKISSRDYLNCIKKSVEDYRGDRRHYHFLRMMTVYGGVIAPESEREKIFRSILDEVDKGIIMPSPAWKMKNRKSAEETIRTGAVWAELNEKTRRLKPLSERVAVARQVQVELAKRQDGGVAAALAGSWIATDTNRHRRTYGDVDDPDARKTPAPAKKPVKRPDPDEVIVGSKDLDFQRDPGDTGSAEATTLVKAYRIAGWSFLALGVILVFAGLIVDRRTGARP